MYNEVISKYPQYKNTCSINDLKDGCITFIRSKKFLNLGEPRDIVILVPKGMDELPDGWRYEFVDNVDYVFTMVHNTLYKDFVPLPNVIGKNCFVHPSAVLDIEGMHLTKTPDGNSRIQLKHLGNVVLEDDVRIMAFVSVQKSVFGSTVIKRGVFIDSHANIGHNNIIGENTIFAAWCMLCGSVEIGKNCMIGVGTIIRNGISICDDVIIGMGSVVVSNITEPGIYMGSPAKFFKPYNKEWNF